MRASRLVDLGRVGDAVRPAAAWRVSRPLLELAERPDHQGRAAARELVVELAGRRLGTDGHVLGGADGAGVQSLLHAHDRDRRLRVAGHDGALDRAPRRASAAGGRRAD